MAEAEAVEQVYGDVQRKSRNSLGASLDGAIAHSQ